jgi:hypothetical protein
MVGTEYKAVASFQLMGEAELSSVKSGVIYRSKGIRQK